MSSATPTLNDEPLATKTLDSTGGHHEKQQAHDTTAHEHETVGGKGYDGKEQAAVTPSHAVNSEGIPTFAGLSGSKLIWTVTAYASCGFLLFGYDQGVMSGIISAPQFLETFPQLDPDLVGTSRSALLQALYVALYEIGCLGGAIFCLAFGDRIGRHRAVFYAAFIMIIGVTIQVTAFAGHQAGAQFVIGRIITGVGNGMNTATLPTYLSETTKSHNRGLLVCIEGSMIATGTAIAYWIDFGLSFDGGSAAWRVPIAFQSIFCFIMLVGVSVLPESPRWLILSGQMKEGQRVVAALHPAPFDSETAILSTRVIHESIASSTAGGASKSAVLTNGPTQHLRRTLIGASSQIMQQIGGCNAVIYFAPVIFQQNLGLDRQLSLILGGVNVTVYALAATMAYPTIERVGRRNLFLIGSAGQALSMFIIMGCDIPGNPQIIKGSVFGLFLFLIFFGWTWLSLPWLYPAEINPLATRTNANAISTINNWLFNFAIVMATPPMLAGIGWKTFMIFGIINVAFIPPIWFFYPETAGRSLEEIDIIFGVAYVENRSYVEVAKNMPRLSENEIESEAQRLGLTDVIENNKRGAAEAF